MSGLVSRIWLLHKQEKDLDLAATQAEGRLGIWLLHKQEKNLEVVVRC